MLNNEKKKEKLIGILLNSKLNFESHTCSLCKQAGEKMNALGRLKSYLTLNQGNVLLYSIIKSQFTYCAVA